jgi:hypothetical protein
LLTIDYHFNKKNVLIIKNARSNNIDRYFM